jgi:uncharacterized membrane protein YcaP (DUF421 family)
MQIILRSLALFLFVWLITRAMGRKELAELSSFELILLVAVGDLIQQGVTGDDRSVVGAMLAVTTFGLLTVAFSYASFRWKRVAHVLQGDPVIVIHEGKPLEKVLSTERLSLEDVHDAARQQGIDDLADVRLAVLEADGKFSFLRTDGGRPPRGRAPEPTA